MEQTPTRYSDPFTGAGRERVFAGAAVAFLVRNDLTPTHTCWTAPAPHGWFVAVNAFCHYTCAARSLPVPFVR